MYYKGMHVYIDYNKYIDHHFMTIVIILYQQQKHQKAGEHLTLSGTWLKSQEYNHNHTCTHGVLFLNFCTCTANFLQIAENTCVFHLYVYRLIYCTVHYKS